MQVTVYDTSTGAVLRALEVYNPADAPLQAGAGQAWLEGKADPDTEYFPGGTRTPRPDLPVPTVEAATTGAAWVISGIPDGTEIFTDGEPVGTADGSDVELSFPYAGTWIVDFKPPFPWRDALTEVTVT